MSDIRKRLDEALFEFGKAEDDWHFHTRTFSASDHAHAGELSARESFNEAQMRYVTVRAEFEEHVESLRESRRQAWRDYIRITHELHEVGEETL